MSVALVPALTDDGAGHGAEVQLLDHRVPLLQLPLQPHHLEDRVTSSPPGTVSYQSLQVRPAGSLLRLPDLALLNTRVKSHSGPGRNCTSSCFLNICILAPLLFLPPAAPASSSSFTGVEEGGGRVEEGFLLCRILASLLA